MGSLTKKWKAKQEVVKQMIMDGHKRGVCNNEGQSVKRNGVYVPKPKVRGVVTFHKVYKRCHLE